jgi:hypothetical protein
LCVLAVNALYATPRIVCESPKYDFGAQISGEPIQHEFILVNRGDDPLEILKIKNCCGVKSTVTPMIIPPGSNAVCSSTFMTKSRSGPQDKQILLVTNDRRNSYFDLRMNGLLLKPVQCSPRLIRLGKVVSDSNVSVTLTATNQLEQSISLNSVSCTVKELSAKIIQSNDRDWSVQLKSAGVLPPGKLHGYVMLEFSTGMEKIPLLGTVVPIVQVTPDCITLGASSEKIERLILLRSGDDRAFEVLSAELQKAEGVVGITQVSPAVWRCAAYIDPASIQEGACLQIRTSASRAQIDVPVLSVSK